MAEMKRVFELVAVRVADNLIRSGRGIHRRFAVGPFRNVDPEFDWAERWRMGVLQFVFFGDQLKFSQRELAARGVCTRRVWERYTDVLAEAGVLIKVERVGCWWASDWNRHRLGVMLRRGLIALPYPIDLQAPRLFQTRGAVTQLAQRTQPAQLRQGGTK